VKGGIRDNGMMVFQMYSDQARLSVDIFVRHPIEKIKDILEQAGHA
jgi:hypothetical protein